MGTCDPHTQVDKQDVTTANVANVDMHLVGMGAAQLWQQLPALQGAPVLPAPQLNPTCSLFAVWPWVPASLWPAY